MKHGKKLSRSQREWLESKRIKYEDWLVSKDTPDEMVLVHKYCDKIKRIPKYRKETF